MHRHRVSRRILHEVELLTGFQLSLQLCGSTLGSVLQRQSDEVSVQHVVGLLTLAAHADSCIPRGLFLLAPLRLHHQLKRVRSANQVLLPLDRAGFF